MAASVASHLRICLCALSPPTTYVDWYRREPVLKLTDMPHKPVGRVAASKAVDHVLDLREDQGYLEHNPRVVALVESAGARTPLSEIASGRG
jgi:hypothetical protein